MAQFAGPYTTANMDQPQWEKVEAGLWTDGIMNGIDNSMLPTLTSGLGVSVATGRGIVDGFRIYNDAAQALTAGAADPTNPRIDRIVFRIDGTGHTGVLAIKAGTPAPSPTPPALTQTTPAGTYEISLAQIRINAAAVTIASLTDERTFTKPNIAPNGITSAQIASVAAASIQAGAIGAGVTLPAGQVSAGNLNIGAGTLSTDGNLVRTNGAGVLIASQFRPALGNAGINAWAIFAGTGSGNFSHSLGATPQWVGITPHVAGSATIGYDSENGTTTNITLGASLAWRATAWQ